MQTKFAVDRADFGRLDQARMRHGDRVQRALELLQPEIEEFVQLRETAGKDRSPARRRSVTATDDPAAGRGYWPWSIRSLRAAGESLAKPKSVSNPFCPPSQHGHCSETRSSIASLKNEEVVYFQGTSSILPPVLTARPATSFRKDSTELHGRGFPRRRPECFRCQAWNRHVVGGSRLVGNLAE